MMTRKTIFLKMGTKKNICFLLIPTKIKKIFFLIAKWTIHHYIVLHHMCFYISMVALKDFNFLSKYVAFSYLMLFVTICADDLCFDTFIAIVLMILLISLQKCVNICKKQCIFSGENISSVYLIILLSTQFFWKNEKNDFGFLWSILNILCRTYVRPDLHRIGHLDRQLKNIYFKA